MESEASRMPPLVGIVFVALVSRSRSEHRLAGVSDEDRRLAT
jgi:hypothetical protein